MKCDKCIHKPVCKFRLESTASVLDRLENCCCYVEVNNPDEFIVNGDIDFIASQPIKSVIVLPCKVGTPVFIINKKGQIFSGKFRLDDIDQFGKRVFLTRSEAEAALKAKINKAAVLNRFMKGAEQ